MLDGEIEKEETVTSISKNARSWVVKFPTENKKSRVKKAETRDFRDKTEDNFAAPFGGYSPVNPTSTLMKIFDVEVKNDFKNELFQSARDEFM